MSLVLDGSATLAWIYGDETTDGIRAVFDRVLDDGATVPALWRLEVANSLQMAVRRKRVSEAFRDATLADLGWLKITVDPQTEIHAWGATLRLADRLGLTLYDAAYLELAYRERLPLASLDRPLRAAAQSLGVEVLGMTE
ncbi:MAG: type II toxin-antitoxin system VapC family toxin [Alphaproteobacteria bacterium]|nr:type II toxin-antitoxin system VapC family toxin [Alphaproteobacteria bacterium]